MVDIDDDLESQEADERDHTSHKATLREKRLGQWSKQFYRLDWSLQEIWTQTHRLTKEDTDEEFGAEIYLEPLPDAAARYPKGDQAFDEFLEFSEDVRRQVTRSKNFQRGSTLADIGDDDRPTFLLDGLIPTAGITLDYGKPKTGKSAWAQKVAVCIAAGLDFDGEPVPRGRVLIVTLDPGARKRNVKPRLMEICNRLGAEVGNNLVIVDDPVILNDPQSVASLLRKNPGEFVLVIIDPLYKAIIGELTQQSVMEAASEGMKTIADETGAAVLILHHEGRGDSTHAYGSIFLDAAVDAGMHTVRKDDRVVVTADAALFKNTEPREAPFVYRLEGPYLESVSPAAPRGKSVAPAEVPHREMLALIPDGKMQKRDARKLIEPLLSGTPEAREKQWARVRASWEAAGLIVQKGGMMWKVTP